MADELGLRITDHDLAAVPVSELVDLALRRNPRRAHLLVSRLLGKHVPADPRLVYGIGQQLGEAVGGVVDHAPALVLGYAETATALGQVVADHLDADYLHSTRRAVPGLAGMGFEEAHSHASTHRLLPEVPTLLARPGPLVIVDDEMSTGATAMNTIAALHRSWPRERYVVAALVDVRSSQDSAQLGALACRLQTQVEVVCLASGTLTFGAGFAERAAAIVAADPPPTPLRRGAAPVVRIRAAWPPGVREGARHGFGPPDRARALLAAGAVAAQLGEQVGGGRVLVLGFEELMYAPLRIAGLLAELLGDAATVRFSSTTRSPVHVLDAPGYPIRTALRFPAHDDPADGPGPRYAYNVAPRASGQAFSDIVLVIDDRGDTPRLHEPGGLLWLLAHACDRVLLVVLPTYRPGTA